MKSASAQSTSGYNNKIPEQIMTPDTVETQYDAAKRQALSTMKAHSLRYGNWKIVFAEQRAHGLQEPFVALRLAKIFELRSDPFEEADSHTTGYDKWRFDRNLLLVPAQDYVGRFLATFREFPPS